jgi:hypothetical protein
VPRARLDLACRFRRLVEVAFAFVLSEGHSSFDASFCIVESKFFSN